MFAISPSIAAILVSAMVVTAVAPGLSYPSTLPISLMVAKDPPWVHAQTILLLRLLLLRLRPHSTTPPTPLTSKWSVVGLITLPMSMSHILRHQALTPVRSSVLGIALLAMRCSSTANQDIVTFSRSSLQFRSLMLSTILYILELLLPLSR